MPNREVVEYVVRVDPARPEGFPEVSVDGQLLPGVFAVDLSQQPGLVDLDPGTLFTPPTSVDPPKRALLGLRVALNGVQWTIERIALTAARPTDLITVSTDGDGQLEVRCSDCGEIDVLDPTTVTGLVEFAEQHAASGCMSETFAQ